MPGPTRWRGPALVHAVDSNKVNPAQLDDRVRAILKLVSAAGKPGIRENAAEAKLDREEDRRLLRQVAAQSIVLLKNQNSILPLSKTKRIAIIGPNSKVATYCGGGSASLNPYSAVTPYEGIKALATCGVDFAQGAYGHQSLPYNEPPEATERHLIEERLLSDSMVFFLDYSHPNIAPIWYAEAEGIYTPAVLCTSGV